MGFEMTGSDAKKYAYQEIMQAKRMRFFQRICLFVIFVVFFSSALSQLFGGWISFIDEAVLLFALLQMNSCIFFRTGTKQLQRIALALIFLFFAFIFVTIFWGIPSTSFYKVKVGDLFYIALGSATHLKTFIFIWLLLFLSERGYISTEARVVSILLGVTLFGYAANVVMPSLFDTLFSYRSIERFGRLRAVGFHLTTVAGPTFVSFLLLTVLYSIPVRRTGLATLFIFFSIVTVFVIFGVTTTRSGLMTFGIGLMFYFLINKYGAIFSLYAMTVLLIFLVGSEISTYTNSDIFVSTRNLISSIFVEMDFETPRSVVLYNAITLSKAYFPFGAGVTFFASPYAADSPVYAFLGISSLPFVDAYNGVMDSNLGSILGELGGFGVLSFLFVIFILSKYVLSRSRLRLDHRKTVFFLAFIVVALVLNSITSPVFFKGDWSITFAIIFQKLAFSSAEKGTNRIFDAS